MIKRLIIVVLLVGIAAIAGVIRSHSKSGGSLLDFKVASSQESAGETSEEIRKTYELSPGAQVDIGGINGPIKVETSDSQTAEVYIARKAKSAEGLSRRKISIESSPSNLKIRGVKEKSGFFGWFYRSHSSEEVTLRLPRKVSFSAGGVNGSVIVGEIDGSVEIHGVNGKVDVSKAKAAKFRGINGSVVAALDQVDYDQVSLAGINGNIELRLTEGANFSLETKGMNGRVFSDLPEFYLEESKRGKYRAQIGKGGNTIEAKGINGNIRLSRAPATSAPVEQARM